jgi:hypothetical protein
MGANPFVRKRTPSVANLGSGVRVGLDAIPESSGAAFKILALPRSGKERAMQVDDDDVFGHGAAAVENKGKRKRTSDESDAENQMEKANKTVRTPSLLYFVSQCAFPDN